MNPERAADAFATTANVALYVQRDATEQALFELVRSVREEGRCAALLGPPGLGKTLLLHLLAERVSDSFDPVYVANGAMAPPELCAWVLGHRELPEADVPMAALIEHARERQAAGRPLLLLLDDVGAIPPPTLVELRRLAAASVGALP